MTVSGFRQDELACSRCQPLEHRVAQLESVVETLAEANNDLAEELAGSRSTIRTLERQLAKKNADLLRATEQDPESKQIKGLQEYWKKATGHHRAKVSMSGERAKLIKAKLRTYTVEELMEAIDGVALLPYKHYANRLPNGKPEQRLTKLEHCIGNDDRIDENRAIYQRACKGAEHNPKRLWDEYQHRQAQADMYFRYALSAAQAPDDDEDRAKAIRLVDQFEAQWAQIEADFPTDFAFRTPDDDTGTSPVLRAVA